jgi:hypothetical protein
MDAQSDRRSCRYVLLVHPLMPLESNRALPYISWCARERQQRETRAVFRPPISQLPGRLMFMMPEIIYPNILGLSGIMRRSCHFWSVCPRVQSRDGSPDPEKAPYLVLDQKIVSPLSPVPAWNEFCPTHLNRTQKVCFNRPSIA